MDNIKAGYLASITTWENDADNYKTKNIPGLTKDQCLAIKKFCGFFISTGLRDDTEHFGNNEYADFDFIVANMSPEELVSLQSVYPRYEMSDITYELIGRWCYCDYYRVFENIKFFYIPVDINQVEL